MFKDKNLKSSNFSELKLLFDEQQRLAQIGSWVWDIGKDEISLTDEAYRIVGFEPNPDKIQMDKCIFYTYMSERDKRMVAEAIENALKEHTLFNVEFWLNLPDGKKKYLNAKGSTRYDADGLPVFMTGICQDITERKLREMNILREKEILEDGKPTTLGYLQDITEREKAKKAIQESENKYQSLFESIVEGYCIIDVIFDSDTNPVDYRFLELNPSFENQTGLHEAKGKLMRDLAPQHEDHWFEIYGKVALTGESVRFENEAKALNRWFDVYAFKIGKQDSRKVSVLFSDITERKRADIEKKRNAEFVNTVLSLSQDFINKPLSELGASINKAMMVVGEYLGVDRSSIYKYDWENEVVRRLYGWDKELGRDTGESWDIVSCSAIADIVECHKKGAPHFVESITNYPQDSLYINVMKQRNSLSTGTFPILVDGELWGTLGFSTVTELKKWQDIDLSAVHVFIEMLSNVLLRIGREKKLQETSENNRLIIDSTNDGIAMFDREGNLLNTNHVFSTRYKLNVEDLIGKNMKLLWPAELFGDLFEQRLQRFRKVFDTGLPEIFEDSRGNSCFENRVYPIFIEGKVAAITLFSTDITDRKKAEEEALYNVILKREAVILREHSEELAQKNKLITEFFTNISHEFKTPLSIILLQLELMMLFMNDAGKMQEIIAVVTQNAYRLSRLIGNLLDITKIEAGYLKVHYTNADIVSLLQDICDSVDVYARDMSIKLSFDTLMSVKEMPIDIEKIERILLNLLSNAIKHTKKDGGIEVHVVDNKDGGVVISVEDTGIGIPEDKLVTIFDRFAQVDTSFSRLNEGCGIGLALVKSLVEMLEGKISVKSVLGKGSKFTIELPLIEINSETSEADIFGFNLAKKVEMELSDL